MKTLRRIIKYLIRIVAGFVGLLLLYLLVAFTLSHIRVSGHQTSADRDIAIYVITNGVHSDLVVPVKNDVYDWSQKIPFENTVSKLTDYNYLAFGWGDKGFYLETPAWKDLKASTAFKAVTGLDTTAMHTTFYHTMQDDEETIKIWLSTEEYQDLIRFIDKRFQEDEKGNYIFIPTNAVYGDNDAFYEAKGRYNLFYTCNTWTNEGLKVSGQDHCLWTPFDKGIFWVYKNKKEAK